VNEAKLNKFLALGLNASYHYAAESGEWDKARTAKAAAMKIYWDNPHLQERMRQSANFLWNLDEEIKLGSK